MLISRRKEGEMILIGDDVEVRIIEVRKKKVILGVVAPRNVKVGTGKLSPAALANTVSAMNSAQIDVLLKKPVTGEEAPVLLLQANKKQQED